MMVATALALVLAQEAAVVALPTDFRGRYACRFATRHAEPSEIDLWLYEGKASISASHEAKIDAARDAAYSETAAFTTGETSLKAMTFRSGSSLFEIREYRTGRMPRRLFVTVTHDADETSGIAYETAAGFCVPVIPMPAPRTSQ